MHVVLALGGRARSALGSLVRPETIEHPDVRFGLWVTAGTFALLIFVGVLFTAPLAILFLGMILGCLSALVATGIVLIYRSSRIINFAQGDLGGIAGVLGASLLVVSGWPFLLAVATGLAAALAVGAAVEFLVIRRFATAPRLILTLVTIALAQILAFGQLVIPSLFGFDVAPQDFPTPFDFNFEWFPVVFRGNHLLVLLVVPVVMAGLAAFLRLTSAGVAIRASAESADRAALLGVPVKHINTLVWVIAAGLSGIAVLLRAPIVGIDLGSAVGPTVLLRALAAAVIGRMENLRITFAAALVLGIVEQAVLWETGRAFVVDAVLFAVIMGALLLQRGGTIVRAGTVAASTWVAAREVRPIPQELRRVGVVRLGILAMGGVTLGLLVVVPLALDGSQVNLLGIGVILAIVGVSLVILTGWAGQISLGQMAFAGFGSAVAGALALQGTNFFLCLLVAAVVGALVAVVIGAPALKIHGPFLAVATLAFALATGSFFLNREFFPWLVPDERIRRPILFGKFDLESEHAFYFVLLIMLMFVLAGARSIHNSRTGRAIVAMRDNASAAQSFGMSPVLTRLTAFALSGFVAALAGALLVFHQHTVTSLTLRPEGSLLVFSMVVIGGVTSLPGAVLGAAYFTLLRYSPLTQSAAVQLLGSGVGVLVILLLLPGGLGGLLYDARDGILRRVAKARGIVVPSLLADVRVGEENLMTGDGESPLGGTHPAEPRLHSSEVGRR